MQLYKKHPKPIQQAPSPKLVSYLQEVSVPKKPVADIACGYGRNGAYLAAKDHSVIFVDMDRDCLRFIASGKDVAETGDIPLDKILTLNLDLTEKWPFPAESLGGLICVHFYFPGLLSRWLPSIAENGFLYLETIEARACNADTLPYKNEIRNLLMPDFIILHYSERKVKNAPGSEERVACCAFAIKKAHLS